MRLGTFLGSQDDTGIDNVKEVFSSLFPKSSEK